MAKAKKQVESVHDRDRIIVRLPDGMRDRIAALAESNGRSMTAEVVAALEQHLRGPSRLDALEEFIERYRPYIAVIEQISHDLDKLEKKVEAIDFGLVWKNDD